MKPTTYQRALIGASVALKSEGTSFPLFPLPLQEELSKQGIKWSSIQEAYDQYLITCFAYAAINQSPEQIRALGLSEREEELATILREMCSLPGSDAPITAPLQITQHKE